MFLARRHRRAKIIECLIVKDAYSSEGMNNLATLCYSGGEEKYALAAQLGIMYGII